MAEGTSPRGVVHAKVRITGIRPGVLFLPFHYGYWDQAGDAGSERHAGDHEIHHVARDLAVWSRRRR
ncbi:molybdopterin dinucleotide binding domain-containing protein [Actinomadura madurae]|nr:molybdopterin dinucleotide binding domain-containing protein [Actinomadura madurae]MCP9978834.1 hypothetical protein [Actinomadura madurae]MCQ0009638.1 hypothetical protein [Actinomadura madurae]